MQTPATRRVLGTAEEHTADRARQHAGDDTLAELEMLVGYDDDLAGEVTRISNRIRGLLTQIHPPLERVLGPKVQHAAVLEVLSRCGGPAGLRKAGRSKLTEIVKPRAPRMGPAGRADLHRTGRPDRDRLPATHRVYGRPLFRASINGSGGPLSYDAAQHPLDPLLRHGRRRHRHPPATPPN